MLKSHETTRETRVSGKSCRLRKFPVGFAGEFRPSLRDQWCNVRGIAGPLLCKRCDDAISRRSRSCREFEPGSLPEGENQSPGVSPSRDARKRCLLSGWAQKLGPAPDRLPAAKRPASDFARIPNEGPYLPAAQLTKAVKLSPASPLAASKDPAINYDGGSTGSPDVTPDPSGLPPVNYVIVPETSTPHDTLASAQLLPDVPYFGVVGTLGAGDGIDLFRLTIDNIPDRLDFGLVMQGPGGSVPGTLQILDGSGQVLGTWKLGSVGNSSIQVDIEKLSPRSSLYLGLSAGNSSTPVGAFGTVEYQLWVAHEPALRLTSSKIGSPTQLRLALTVLTPLLIPPTVVGLPSPHGVSAAALTAPGSVSVTSSVTVGSLAIRSAGASRGLLSDNEEPAPPAVQEASTSAPQEVAAGSLARAESEHGGELRPGEPAAAGRDPGASVVLISTGGFPLMGATAVGYWRERGPDHEAVSGIAGPALEERSNGAESIGDPDLVARPAALLAEGETIAEGQAFPLRTWGGFPVSVYSGLGVAIVLTLNHAPICLANSDLLFSSLSSFPPRKPTNRPLCV